MWVKLNLNFYAIARSLVSALKAVLQITKVWIKQRHLGAKASCYQTARTTGRVIADKMTK